MILLSPTRASAALGTACATPSGRGEDTLLEQLRVITTHVEAACSCATFVRAQYRDTFEVPKHYKGLVYARLSNGFVDTSSVTVEGLTPVDGAASPVSLLNGDEGTLTVKYSGSEGDTFSITYVSGFAVPVDAGDQDNVHPDEAYRIAQGTPEWMARVVVTMLTNWRRNQLKVPDVSKEYGFLPSLNEAVLRELKGAVYSRYMRPRHGYHWPVNYVKVGPAP